MNKNGLLRFLEDCGLGVLCSIGPDGGPQSALVGIAVTPELEIVFDTVATSRKFANIGRDQRVAFVMGWQGEITVQYEGIARQISSTEIGPYQETYFRKFPDGPARMKWAGITYYVVAPKWIRYSDYNTSPPEIVEFTFPDSIHRTAR
jgi:pyridoxine/pyridoxamine 5'-phosphate oxidase